MFNLPVQHVVNKTCGKQYVGNTTNHLRSRQSNHKSEIEKLRVVTWKMPNKRFFKIFFKQNDHQGFLEDEKVRLTDKTQTSDPTKLEFY